MLDVVSFAYPWALAGLALLPFLPRGRGWPVRAAALGLLVIAVAQPRVAGPGGHVAILVDVSDSVDPAARARVAAFDFGGLGEQPSFYHFAAEAGSVPEPGREPTPDLGLGATDIGRALQVAAADGADRILLVSDGAQSRGDALTAAPDVPVDTLQVSSQPNARLVELVAPPRATPGETVEVVAVVDTDRPGRLVLRPEVAGAQLEPVVRDVDAGTSSVPFRFTIEDTRGVTVRAAIDVDWSQPVQDDTSTTEIGVRQSEPVLVLGDPATARLLRVQGFDVHEGTAADVTTPFSYSAVVVREGAGDFTPGQLELLRGYVERGGGLLMTGGPDAFGFGAWYRTPVEEVLPVTTDLRTDVALPLVAMVIIVDRSQSMSTGTPSKIELAKEGAIGVVELAYQDDLLGMIAFSDADAAQWVFSLRPATERGKREMVNAILGLTTSGGTVLEPAYRMALEELAATEAALKHVIVLSDGKLYDGRGPFADGPAVDFGAMAAQGLQMDITTSTIAIGEAAEYDQLEQIARAGGGRYYAALDVATLPRIFTNEALTATRSLLREDAFAPIPRRHPLLPPQVEPPAVDAYVATHLKSDAEMVLEAVDGEPLLAVRRQGLGRSAALTTDLNGWAGSFGAWQELPALMGTVVRWLQSRPAEYAVNVAREGERLRVVVDAVEDGAYLDGKNLEARFQGQRTVLEQVAPGRYEAAVAAGDGRGTLLVVEGGEVVARTEVSTPSAEFTTAGGDLLLAQLAARTGGDVLAEPGRYAPAVAGGRAELWPWLAAAGLVLFLAELAWRRFGREPSGA